MGIKLHDYPWWILMFIGQMAKKITWHTWLHQLKLGGICEPTKKSGVFC